MEIIYGTIAGVVASLGMGGGTILILLLSLFTNFDQHIAQGTNLIFFIPTAITSGIINSKRNLLDKNLIIKYAILGRNWFNCWGYISKYYPGAKIKKIFWIFFTTYSIL